MNFLGLNTLGCVLAAMFYLVITVFLQEHLENSWKLSRVKSIVLAICWPGPAIFLLYLLACFLDLLIMVFRR